MHVRRLENGPVIKPHMDRRMGANINGPSLIRVPAWVKRPLGKYYLYFSQHGGNYIRLAYADRLEGPWRTYEPGVLQLGDTGMRKQISAPDVHVDEERREIRMYYQGGAPDGSFSGDPALILPLAGSTRSAVAISEDGLHFTPLPGVFGGPYPRVFRWHGWYYMLCMPGLFFCSRDGLSGFERGPVLFDENMRHSAVIVVGDTLYVFYSRVQDCPERILVSKVELKPSWWDWKESPPVVVLEPELEYEGANLPLKPSRRGAAQEPVRELRDPAIFLEDGKFYLAYTVAGERGIALAHIEDFP